MMALLTSKHSFVETFRTVGSAFSSSQLPTGWAIYALIVSWSATSVATYITTYANASIAVIAFRTSCVTFSAL